MSLEYDANLPERIQSIYNSCSADERRYLVQILQEISSYGYSETYEQIWLADFKEIPVSIDEFICNPLYLGETNRNGDAVYPFWRDTARDIFSHGNQYNEIILSGATRIGKTSESIIISAYMLYRLMLYRDPHSYFQKKQVSKFTIAFANLTKELAEGVAFREFNDTLKNSQWFNEHGKFSRSDRKFYYIPEGDKIDILAASDAAHLLGMQIWCLVGDTKIMTPDGVMTLEDAANSYQEILQLNAHGELDWCVAPVLETKRAEETIRITLEDGSTIEGTPEHQVMLSDGTYESLGDLTEDDDLLTFNTDKADQMKVAKIERIHHETPIPVYDVINAGESHNFAVVLGDSLAISHNCCVMDETNFAKAGIKDINIAKQHMKNLYDTVNARISGTFRIGGEVYGKLIASSSKNTDSDFLSDHIESQLNAGNTHLYLVDKPQWEVLPKSMFSDKVFHFTVGDRYKRGFVIPPENDDAEHHEEYIRQGYTVMEAPEEMRRNFLADYDISLRDIAGISVVGAMGFITQEAITPNLSQTRHNPFYTDTIQVGTKDNRTIEEFFRVDVVAPSLKRCLMNIHLDLSESGDRTGIDGVCVDGYKLITDYEGKKVEMPYLREVFAVGVEHPPGDRLSFQKVVNFLLWLRRTGFNIGTISTDQYQSSYLRELLSAQGFKTEKISVDRSEEPYIGLKNILYDQRIELIKNDIRDYELVNLQRVNGKIDHKTNGSKDIADCLCGACWTLTTEHAVPKPSPKSVASVISSVNGRNSRPGIGSLPSVFQSPYRNYNGKR